MSTRDPLRLAVAAVAAAAFVATWHYYIDDLYIYGTFARHFARGLGFTHNAGDGPTHGMTGPLYVVLLAPFAPGGAGLCLFGAKLWGLAGAVGTAWSLGATCYPVLPRHPAARALAGWLAALTVLTPMTFRWMACGMETPLAALCLAEVGRAVVVPSSGTTAARRLSVWLGLGLLLRPEFVLVGAVVGAALLAVTANLPLAPRWPGLGDVVEERRRLAWLALPLVLYAGWLVHSWLSFGDLRPNAVRVKQGLWAGLVGPPFGFLRELAVQTVVLAGVPLALGALAGAVVWVRGRRDHAGGFAPASFFASVSLLVLIGYYAGGAPISGRYLALFAPAALGSMAAAALAALLGRSRGLARATLALATGASLVTVPQLLAHLERHTAGNRAMMAAGLRLRDRTDPEERIVAADVGVIGYAAERDVLDITGLISPGLIGRSVPEVLERLRPRYFVLRPHQLRLALGDPPRFGWREIERFHYPSFGLSDREGDDYVVGEFVYSASAMSTARRGSSVTSPSSPAFQVTTSTQSPESSRITTSPASALR
jgi:hypothetical protein